MRSLINIVSDYIAQTTVMEQAFARKEARRKVSDMSIQINLHLVKILMLPSNISVVHWKKEVCTFLETVTLAHFNSRTGNFKESEYFTLLFVEPIGTVEEAERYVDLVISKYKVDPSTDVPSVVLQLNSDLRNFYTKLCPILSASRRDFPAGVRKMDKIVELVDAL